MPTDVSQNHGSRLPAPVSTTASPRGQSEPLAALVAVSLVCLVVSGHVVLFDETVPTTGTERSVGQPTADALWQEISDDGMVTAERPITAEIGPETLPAGYNVAVTISYIDARGIRKEVAAETFDRSGQDASMSAPKDAEQVTRAVTVRVGPGDKRPGQFTVEVWE